jgi:putative hydrolase of the HAD superfamily
MLDSTCSDIRLVCFDLGRVFVRICDDWRHGCRVAAIPDPPPLNAEAATALEELVCRSDLGDVDARQFADLAAPLLGLTSAQVQRLSDSYLLGLFPGIDQMLDDLRAAGLATACLSNTNVNHWRLVTDPAAPCFLPLHKMDHHFVSFKIRARKPDAAIYTHVERATGLAGRQIAFFDDLAENVDAAAQRGWQAIRIDPSLDPMAQARSALERLGVLQSSGDASAKRM